MAIGWIRGPGLLECGDRTGSIAELLAQLAKREPRRGIAGRKLERLDQQICCACKIALRLAIARLLETPVGDDIAGGEENRTNHSCVFVVTGRMPI